MNKKKKQRRLTALIIIILLAILIALIAFSKSNANSTNLNLVEKRWIENNKKEVINVSVVNSIPVFSLDGEGVFFDYLEYLEKETGLSFNLIPYDVSSDVQENDLYYEVIKADGVDKLKDDAMVFYKDYYVLIGNTDEKIDEPYEIKDKKIGVLSSDLSNVSYYLPSNGTINYSSYEEEEALKSSLEKNEVDYIAVPKNRYLELMLEKSYHIVYNITELKEAYVLKTSKQANEHLASIVNKNYINYKNKELKDNYNNYLISLLLTEKNISEKSKADFLSKKYSFGYIENAPYTGTVNNKLIGLDSTYLNNFSEITGATFQLKKYKTVNDLAKALNSGDVDFAPNYYNYSGLNGNYVNTVSPYTEEYYVLAYSKNTNLVVNSIRSLNGKKVVALNNYLAKYLEKEAKASITTYDKVSTLLNKISKDSIIAVDKNTYEMYKNDELSNYRIIYSDKANLNYGFIIKDSNENATFKALLTTYLETINYKQLYNSAWKDYNVESKEVSYGFLYLLGAVVVLFIAWLFLKKKIKIKKKTKREETIRYIDPLTSLKNRNYLNKNFKKWENNAIYPQSIIIVNLNNLRHINDVYGHEEGDKIIRLAANTLIKNQLEQSDIIRTDGNEYLIYMVGYAENKVISYMRKLYKELDELPYGFGATLGYSMIEDDIKTIDDAINEAVLEIRTNREMKNKNK